MLWYKGWQETRLRLWIALGYMGILLAFYSLRTIAPSLLPPPPYGAKPSLGIGLILMMGSFVTVMCMWFAGAGIASQGTFQFLKGLHGSTQYTLSLPVSRLPVAGRTSRSRMAGNGWCDRNVLLRSVASSSGAVPRS